MRVALLHNEKASGSAASDGVVGALTGAGHLVVARTTKIDAVDELLAAEPELLVVAGGDGTVRRAAVRASGRGVPLAVIPLGTANNIAASLGFEGGAEEIARTWERARRTALDMGLAHGPWGERCFLESAGAGLVERGISAMDAEAPHPEEGDPAEMLSKAARRFGEVLEGLRPRPCRIALDGEERSADVLLIEVLNIRSIGPRLMLARWSQPSDGWFTVVVAEDEHREELARYLAARERDAAAEIRLPTRHARVVSLSGWDSLHVDDRVLPVANERVLVTLQRAAVDVLSLR